jgi:hypothetical protein
MTCPSIAGVLNIVAVSFNAVGVLILYFFRFEAFGGMESRSLSPDHPKSWQAKAARNKERSWKQWVGVGCIGAGWAAQVIAQFLP